MNKRILCLMVAAPLIQAQTPVAPTPGGTPETFDLGRYKATSSFEAGYRFSAIGGDQGLYRSNVNYGNGLRLLSNSFTANSKDGKGGLFDSLVLSTQGLGNDPYSIATARIEKNNVYRYDGTWRRSESYNPFQVNGESGNLKTTKRDIEEHDVTLNARKWAKFRMGYTRVEEGGPSISSYELYIGGLYPPNNATTAPASHTVSELSLFKDTRRDWNEYRMGGDIDFKGFRFSVTRQLNYYKEDTPTASLVQGQQYVLTNTSVASNYQRSEPMHIQSPTWLGTLSTAHKYWTMNSRISYMKSDSQFIYEETATGTVPTGAQGSVSTFMKGAARRPYVSGDFSFSVLPTTKLSITSSTSALNNRIDGTGFSTQLSTAAAAKNIYWFSYMDVKKFSESLDVNYRPTKWLGLNANYLYTDRSVDQILARAGTTNSNAPGALVNHLNNGTLGFRLKPLKALSVSLDGGVGKDNGPYTPSGMGTYHTFRGRADYRISRLRLSSTYRQLYNLNNPVLNSYNTSHSREVTSSVSYELPRRSWIDLSYSKLHRDTFSALFAEIPVNGKITNVRGYNSVYVSNVHSLSIMTRTQFNRATVTLGYSLTRDTGDGRSAQNLGLADPAAAYLALGQTFPMKYQSPLARLSIRLTPKIQWNAGWELYRYNQQFAYFGLQPYYRAQTGYTSLSLSY